MGSSSSKDVAAGGAHSSSSGGGGREPRSKGVRVVFGSSCFGTPSTLHDDQVSFSDCKDSILRFVSYDLDLTLVKSCNLCIGLALSFRFIYFYFFLKDQ